MGFQSQRLPDNAHDLGLVSAWFATAAFFPGLSPIPLSPFPMRQKRRTNTAQKKEKLGNKVILDADSTPAMRPHPVDA
jgi:hypothetical protein